MKGPESEDRARLHVESAGGGDPAVVLIHGFGAHGHFWRHWKTELAQRHLVHTVDLAGAGRSPAPRDGNYSPDAQAHRVAEFVRSLPGQPPVLIGHSLGAGVALLATLLLRDQDPRRQIPGLVLVSGAVYAQRLPPYLSLARRRCIGELLLLGAPPRPLLRMGLRAIVQRAGCIDAELVEGYREPLRSPARRRALVRAARQIDLDLADALARQIPGLRIPTLLIWGGEDPVVPVEQGQRLARELSEATLIVLPGVGHLPPEEDPAGSLAPVLEFLKPLSRPHPSPLPASAP